MRRTSILAFHDTLESSALGSVWSYSNDTVAQRLAVFDQYSFSLTAEQLPGSVANPSISLTAYHSADGVHWSHKPATVEVFDQPIDPTGAAPPFIGYDDGTQPLLAYLRFLITLESTAGAFGARIKLQVTTNDTRQGAFARRMRKLIAEQNADDPCQRLIPGGTLVPTRPHSWGRRLLDALAASEAASPYGKVMKYAPLVSMSKQQQAKVDKLGASPILQYLAIVGLGSQAGSPVPVALGSNVGFGSASGRAGGLLDFRWKLADDARACIVADGGIILQRPGHGTIQIAAPTPAGDKPGVC